MACNPFSGIGNGVVEPPRSCSPKPFRLTLPARAATRSVTSFGSAAVRRVVRELQAATLRADWYLVIGQDQYRNLHTWYGVDELLQRVTLAVAQRPGEPAEADARVRAAPTVALSMPPMGISATDIRQRVAMGRDISAMVPLAVALYIHQHGLYRGTAGS